MTGETRRRIDGLHALALGAVLVLLAYIVGTLACRIERVERVERERVERERVERERAAPISPTFRTGATDKQERPSAAVD